MYYEEIPSYRFYYPGNLADHGPVGATCRTAKATTAKAASALNCIDCHMPVLPSKKITLQIIGEQQPVHDLVRTHRVAIYPDIAREYLHNH